MVIQSIDLFIFVFFSLPNPSVHNQLEDFANGFESILISALQQECHQLKQIKVDLGKQFADLMKCLLRHCRLYHLMQSEMSSCQTMVKQLYVDWMRLDIDALSATVLESISKYLPTISNNHKSTLHKLIYKCKRITKVFHLEYF